MERANLSEAWSSTVFRRMNDSLSYDNVCQWFEILLTVHHYSVTITVRAYDFH
jgi:hypothetical protein